MNFAIIMYLKYSIQRLKKESLYRLMNTRGKVVKGHRIEA